MKKHMARFVLLLFVVLLVGMAWMCADWLAKIDTLSKTVVSRAGELSSYVQSETFGTGEMRTEFQPNQFHGPIEKNWAKGIAAQEYQPDILQAPGHASPKNKPN